MPRISEKTVGIPPILGICLNRDEWLRYVQTYDFGSIPPIKLVLHHTWKPAIREWHGKKSILAIQRYYAGLGWNAGPHLFAAPDGIWLFTPMYDIGIHANAGNAGYVDKRLAWYSIGLEMVGNYDQVRPAGQIWQYSLAVMGALSRRLEVPPKPFISFHRDYNKHKSCPGWAVTKEWVWAEVTQWLNA